MGKNSSRTQVRRRCWRLRFPVGWLRATFGGHGKEPFALLKKIKLWVFETVGGIWAETTVNEGVNSLYLTTCAIYILVCFFFGKLFSPPTLFPFAVEATCLSFFQQIVRA